MDARAVERLYSWAAGVFDAGGRIYLRQQGANVHLIVTVNGTDKKALETFAEMFGISTHRGTNIKKNTLWVPGARHRTVLAAIMPYSLRYEELSSALALKEKLWDRSDAKRRLAIFQVWKEVAKWRRGQ